MINVFTNRLGPCGFLCQSLFRFLDGGKLLPLLNRHPLRPGPDMILQRLMHLRVYMPKVLCNINRDIASSRLCSLKLSREIGNEPKRSFTRHRYLVTVEGTNCIGGDSYLALAGVLGDEGGKEIRGTLAGGGFNRFFQGLSQVVRVDLGLIDLHLVQCWVKPDRRFFPRRNIGLHRLSGPCRLVNHRVDLGRYWTVKSSLS